MKGNRNKHSEEATPVTETIRLSNGIYQFRYDFQYIPADEERADSFNYNYVNIPNTDRATIITAIIRTRYTADQESAILRKKQVGEDVIDFVKYNHFVTYAKTAADGQDLAQCKEKTVYEINLSPLSITLQGGDYFALADYCLKMNIPYEANPLLDVAKAYPSWIKPEDQAAMENDPRVSVQIINLM
jgi:hypothetical protein